MVRRPQGTACWRLFMPWRQAQLGQLGSTFDVTRSFPCGPWTNRRSRTCRRGCHRTSRVGVPKNPVGQSRDGSVCAQSTLLPNRGIATRFQVVCGHLRISDLLDELPHPLHQLRYAQLLESWKNCFSLVIGGTSCRPFGVGP